MLGKLTTQQRGRCGELIVQYALLKHGIESAPLTTGTGIDLVVYPRVSTKHWPFNRPATIQVKASTHRGGEWIEWNVADDCPADFIAGVDLERNKVWFFAMSDFKKESKKGGIGYRLWWALPDHETKGAHRHERDYIKYEMDEGIKNAFG